MLSTAAVPFTALKIENRTYHPTIVHECCHAHHISPTEEKCRWDLDMNPSPALLYVPYTARRQTTHDKQRAYSQSGVSDLGRHSFRSMIHHGNKTHRSRPHDRMNMSSGRVECNLEIPKARSSPDMYDILEQLLECWSCGVCFVY